MNVFGIGLPELAVIAAIGLLVFGPKRLPELGKTLGRTLKGFQSASSEFEKELRTAIATSELPTAEMPSADAAPAAPAEILAGGAEPLHLATASAEPVPATQAVDPADAHPAA